jgi:hypothetical protein
MSACTTRPPASGTTTRRRLRRSGLWVRRDSVRNSTRVATGARIGCRSVIWRKSGRAASPRGGHRRGLPGRGCIVLDEVLGLDLQDFRQPFARRRVRPGPLASLYRCDGRPSDVCELGQLHLGQSPALAMLLKTRQAHRRIILIYIAFFHKI